MAFTRKLKGASPRKSKTVAKTVRSSKTDNSPVTMPAVNVPPDDLRAYFLFIWGEKGVGKSSLAAQFPNAITLMGEPGRRNLSIRQVPDYRRKEPPLTWERVLAYRDLLLTQKTPGTVIFDTVDWFWDMAQTYICQKKSLNHPFEANDYGQTWNEIREEFRNMMESFRYAGWVPVVISHARESQRETRTGIQKLCLIPTCTGACLAYLRSACDTALYFGFRDKQRTFTLAGSENVWSSIGIEGHFLQPDKEPLREFLAGESAKEAYANLCRAFDNKLYSLADATEETEASVEASPIRVPKRKGRK